MHNPLPKYLFSLFCFTSLLLACTDPSIDNLRQEIQSLKSAQAEANATTELSGVVVNNVTQKPLSEVSVRVNEMKVSTDKDGFFRFEKLPYGEVKLIVTATGFKRLDQTLELKSTPKVHDMALTPENEELTQSMPSSALPSGEPTPLPSAILLPGNQTPEPVVSPSSGVASPLATPSGDSTPTPTASESPSSSPEPTPSPTPLYDPELDKVHRLDVLGTKKSNGLELNFVLQDEQANPISWGHGSVKVEYFISESLDNESGKQQGALISSGISQITQSNDPFIVSLSSAQKSLLKNNVYLSITLTLPDDRQLRRTDFFDVF